MIATPFPGPQSTNFLLCIIGKLNFPTKNILNVKNTVQGVIPLKHKFDCLKLKLDCHVCRTKHFGGGRYENQLEAP